MRDTFIKKLTETAKRDKNIYLLTGDLGFSVFENFQKQFAKRFINAGIAEANMMGVAAGLALSGKTAVTYSIIPFTVIRCLDQIRIDVCYQNTDVKIVGVGAGLAYGTLGVTHQAIEDISVMRAFPNMRILCPCDPFETEACVELALNKKGPVYIRLGKNKEPKIYSRNLKLKFGGSNILKEGKDVTILASGSVIKRALDASDILEAKGIKAGVISMYSLKPVDSGRILERAGTARAIVTLEEHNVIGGLGSAVAEVMAENTGIKAKLLKIGIPDRFAEDVGRHSYLLDKYGFSPDTIADRIMNFAAFTKRQK